MVGFEKARRPGDGRDNHELCRGHYGPQSGCEEQGGPWSREEMGEALSSLGKGR